MKFIRSGVVLRGDEGLKNRMYGGRLLSISDSVGVVAVYEILGTKEDCVTRYQQCDFLKPIYVGEIYEFYYNYKLGKTSISINMEVRVESEVRAKMKYVFVKLKDGKPSEIKIQPIT